MTTVRKPAVWFPAIRCGTGADIFTMRLAEALQATGIKTEITWLPHHAEYAPWSVPIPQLPKWANIVHVNTWLHKRFIPENIPLVATMHHNVHDPALSHYKSTSQKYYHMFWIRRIEDWVLNHAHRVVAVSLYTALKTREVFHIDNIQIIHNGLNTYHQIGEKRTQPNHPFRLLYVGSWSTRKGVDMLAPIMESLGNDFELRFTFGRRYKKIPALPSNCVNIGQPDNQALQNAYITSDALLFPSRLEGFGQVAIEAMACGTPVLATNASALPEVVAHNRTGILCPLDDIRAFVSAARYLAANPDAWRQMSEAAKQKVAREFSITTMVEKYASIYQSLL